MIDLPAYCENCERWTPSGFIVDRAEGFQAANNFVPCRFCGKDGARVIEGTFNIIDDTLDIIESHGLSPKELKQLKQILNQAILLKTPGDKIREIIARDVPKASQLNKFLTEGWNLPFVIQVILAVLMWYIPFSSSPTASPRCEEPPHINKSKSEETSVKESSKPKPKQKSSIKRGKVRVNAPCICGSGKKSKMCCGAKR